MYQSTATEMPRPPRAISANCEDSRARSLCAETTLFQLKRFDRHLETDRFMDGATHAAVRLVRSHHAVWPDNCWLLGVATSRQHDEWTPAIAEALAIHFGVALSPEHWRVVGCAREIAAATGRAADITTLAAELGVAPERIVTLFPPDLDTLAVIAGVHP
jgi:DsrC like protein